VLCTTFLFLGTELAPDRHADPVAEACSQQHSQADAEQQPEAQRCRIGHRGLVLRAGVHEVPSAQPIERLFERRRQRPHLFGLQPHRFLQVVGSQRSHAGHQAVLHEAGAGIRHGLGEPKVLCRRRGGHVERP